MRFFCFPVAAQLAFMAMADPPLRPVISAKTGSGATRLIKSHHNVSGFVLKRRHFHGAQAWVRAVGDGRWAMGGGLVSPANGGGSRFQKKTCGKKLVLAERGLFNRWTCRGHV